MLGEDHVFSFRVAGDVDLVALEAELGGQAHGLACAILEELAVFAWAIIIPPPSSIYLRIYYRYLMRLPVVSAYSMERC